MKAQVISFNCVVKTKLGRFISRTVNHDVLSVAHPDQTILLGLNEGLQNLKEGERRRIDVPAARAYGFYDPEKVISCARESVKDSVSVGDQVPGRLHGKKTMFRVISMSPEEVVLDANHPLAGQDLVFEIEALDVREATPADISGEESGETPRFH
jgi:FKBP-type peptidyl-prolyl cis-trans isomerase SlyD